MSEIIQKTVPTIEVERSELDTIVLTQNDQVIVVDCHAAQLLTVAVLNCALPETDAMERHSIDYKDLLKRYVSHVLECEGDDFVHHANAHISDVKFSKLEVEYLDSLNK